MHTFLWCSFLFSMSLLNRHRRGRCRLCPCICVWYVVEMTEWDRKRKTHWGERNTPNQVMFFRFVLLLLLFFFVVSRIYHHRDTYSIVYFVHQHEEKAKWLWNRMKPSSAFQFQLPPLAFFVVVVLLLCPQFLATKAMAKAHKWMNKMQVQIRKAFFSLI